MPATVRMTSTACPIPRPPYWLFRPDSGHPILAAAKEPGPVPRRRSPDWAAATPSTWCWFASSPIRTRFSHRATDAYSRRPGRWSARRPGMTPWPRRRPRARRRSSRRRGRGIGARPEQSHPGHAQATTSASGRFEGHDRAGHMGPAGGERRRGHAHRLRPHPPRLAQLPPRPGRRSSGDRVALRAPRPASRRRCRLRTIPKRDGFAISNPAAIV